jgi:hypothetical protein
VDPQVVLATLSGVAVTFIGFTGIVFAIGRYSSGGWGERDRMAIIHLLLPSALVLFLALIPLVAATGRTPGPGFWRTMNAVLALIHLPLVGNAARLGFRGRLIEPIPFSYVLVPGGFAVVLLNALVAFGRLQGFATLLYAAGLVWFLVISVVQLGVLILSQARPG